MKLIELFGKSLLGLCAAVALTFTVGCDKGGDDDGGTTEEKAPATEEKAPATEEKAPDAAGGEKAKG